MFIQEMLEKENVQKEFSTQIGTVNVPKERDLYNSIRKKYRLLALEAAQAFSVEYKKYNTCDDILKYGAVDFQKSIAHSIDEMKKDLISMGRYDLDYDTIYQFINDEGYIDAYYEAFDKISGEVMEIYNDVEAKKQYYQEKKNERGKWQGGTFGGTIVDDYAHQIRLAGRNAMEGAAYSAWNAAKGARDKIKANLNLSEIFNKPETFNALREGVYQAAFQLHYGLIDLLEHSGITIALSYPDTDATGTSERLLNNLKSGAIPKEKVNEVSLSIIALDPYNLSLFKYFFDSYGDKDGKWGELAEYYGIDLVSYKANCALKFVKDNQGTTEDDSKKAKEMLLRYCEDITLQISDDMACIQYINKRLEDFDLAYRTVDDVVCKTRDGADFAREELGKITEFMGQVSSPTSESLLDYEEDLLEKKRLFGEMFHSELREKYMGKIDACLAEFDKKFCSIGLFKTVGRKEAGQERLLSLVKKMDTASYEAITQAYVRMRKLLPKVGITEEEAEKTLLYLTSCKDELALKYVKAMQITTEEGAKEAKEKLLEYCKSIELSANETHKCVQYIDKILTDYDIKYRTVDGMVCKTREGADHARDEIGQIKEFMAGITVPTSESLLDYEEDLLEKKKVFEETFNSELKEKYVKKLNALLADFDKKFCSLGVFKAVDRKQAGQERLFALVKKTDVSSPEAIIQAYTYMRGLLPKVGITEEEAAKTLLYLEECKEELALKFIKEIQISNEEEAGKAKEKLLEYCSKLELAVDEKSKCIQYIDKILADYDLKYRTVEGKVYDTREEAAVAHDELEKIILFMQQVSAPAADSLLDYEEDLLAKKRELEDSFVTEVKRKYIAQIDKHLADFDKKFCSVGILKKVDRKEAGKEKALAFVKKLKCDSIDEAFAKLDEFLPKVGLNREEAQGAVEYLEKKYDSQNKSSNLLGRFWKK